MGNLKEHNQGAARRKVLLWVSGTVALFMNTAATGVALFLCGILIAALACLLLQANTPGFHKQMVSVRCAVGIAIVCMVSGFHFYTTWIPSSKVRIIAGMVGLRASAFLIVCAVIGAVAAIPFAVYIAGKLQTMLASSVAKLEIAKNGSRGGAPEKSFGCC